MIVIVVMIVVVIVVTVIVAIGVVLASNVVVAVGRSFVANSEGGDHEWRLMIVRWSVSGSPSIASELVFGDTIPLRLLPFEVYSYEFFQAFGLFLIHIKN